MGSSLSAKRESGVFLLLCVITDGLSVCTLFLSTMGLLSVRIRNISVKSWTNVDVCRII